MSSHFCGAPWAVIANDDLTPCFEFSLRLLLPLYMLILAIASIPPLQQAPVSASFTLSRTHNVLLGFVGFAAIQNLVMLLLNSSLSKRLPDAFPGAPVFMLHFALFALAWTLSAVLLLMTLRRTAPLPAVHSAFWWLVFVFDLKRLESGTLHIFQLDAMDASWDIIPAFVEFVTVSSMLIAHRCLRATQPTPSPDGVSAAGINYEPVDVYDDSSSSALGVGGPRGASSPSFDAADLAHMHAHVRPTGSLSDMREGSVRVINDSLIALCDAHKTRCLIG